jgi:hypothetical protein
VSACTLRPCRKVYKELQGLSDAILLFSDAVDAAFKQDKTVPREAGAKLAMLLNALEMANNRVRYFTLDVDYRRDDKGAAVVKLKKTAQARWGTER